MASEPSDGASEPSDGVSVSSASYSVSLIVDQRSFYADSNS